MDVPGLFPLRIGFISEVRKDTFCTGEPGTVDGLRRSVITPLEECNGRVVQPATHHTGRQVHTVLGGWEGIYTGWWVSQGVQGEVYIPTRVPLPGYKQGGIYPPGCLFLGISLGYITHQGASSGV